MMQRYGTATLTNSTMPYLDWLEARLGSIGHYSKGMSRHRSGLTRAKPIHADTYEEILRTEAL